MVLSPRFEQALQYACWLHSGQLRKGTMVPYVAHRLSVAGLALEYGADEDEAIAALLHDVVEDAGGKARAADLRQRFGDRVADIVQGCTDTDLHPKPPWQARKEAYIAGLADAVPRRPSNAQFDAVETLAHMLQQSSPRRGRLPDRRDAAAGAGGRLVPSGH